MGPITLCAELVLPAEYLRVTPPVPDRREEALPLNWGRGQLFLWFSDWDIRGNDPEEGDEIFKSVMIAAQLTEYPRQLLELAEPSQAEWGGIVDWVSSSEHMEAYHAATAARYQGPAQAYWETTRKELGATAKAATSRWLADEALGEFLRKSAKELNAVVRRLFELLRIEYGQFAIPDPPRFTWRNVLLELPRDVVRSLSQEAVDEWLNTSQDRTAEAFARPLSLTEWPRIASALQAGWKPGLVDVLLANARTECDAAFGNPRLAVIEVITALEIVVKRTTHATLARFSVSKSAIDRIVRETPMVDLVGTWLRPHVLASEYATLERCAEAIRERNELVHHERRNLSFERAIEHVSAVGKLIGHLNARVPAGQDGSSA